MRGMKLIIELNDSDYELLKNAGITIDFNALFHGKERDRELTFSTFNLIESLKNSTPYNPTGNLISREALKEDFKERNIWNPEIVSAIDNAPTVDLKDIYQEGHYDGHLEGYTKAINEERPQARWIATDETDEFYGRMYRCTHCGKETLACSCRNFCPDCGARMGGKE